MQKAISGRDNYVFHATSALFKRKKSLILRLARLYCIYMLTKKSPLRLLDVAITSRCQYRCPHCYPESFYKNTRCELSVEEIVDLVKQAQRMGIVQVNFQGGEPTLDLDRLEAIVSSIHPAKYYVSLSSNGFRHSSDDLLRIREMGVDKIAISLHSGIAEEHDCFVGYDGAYEKVFCCLENARAVGLEATLAATITRDTVRTPGFLKVVEICVALGIILDINVAIPVGRWSGMTEVLLNVEDYRWLDLLNREHPNIRRDLHPHLFRKGCLAGKELLYVNVYGDVLACPFLHFSAGNIRDQRLMDIRRHILEERWFANYNRQCLACENEEFMMKYMTKIFESHTLPLPFDEVFGSNRSFSE